MKRYLAEGFLIIFSVLFALFINKLYDTYKINKQKEIAVESLKKELEINVKILERWRKSHQQIKSRLDSLITNKNDSLKQELKKKDFFDLGVLTNQQSLVDAMMTKTAWETTKSTGIVSELDFETTQRLTLVYGLQDIITQRSINKIVDLYFEAETHQMENIDLILIQFFIRVEELTGQENALSGAYEDMIERLQEN
ncbi:hypothetical protein [Chondrinema litorale]|uniref:hypothetical protein n=1 Tax=Chondrinema litorale TaxID=2994555 RepID=UPI002542D0BC|nr:hypothetical protein [Chondrinema litorale]UZR97019.1 hypothetical protein OQ292_23250 [Chondrinema litorale]